MAQATVVIKVTPNELQMIDEALRMYARATRRLGNEHPLNGYIVDLSISGGDHLHLARQAEKIRQDIGLK